MRREIAAREITDSQPRGFASSRLVVSSRPERAGTQRARTRYHPRRSCIHVHLNRDSNVSIRRVDADDGNEPIFDEKSSRVRARYADSRQVLGHERTTDLTIVLCRKKRNERRKEEPRDRNARRRESRLFSRMRI